MSMTLMRKYSKPLMAVFGVVLMITFLLGYAYTSGLGSNQPSILLGHVAGERITSKSLIPYQIDTRVLKVLAENDPAFDREYMGWLGGSSRSNTTLKFYLLVYEAEHYGLAPDPDFPQDLLPTKAFHRAVATVTANSNFAIENVTDALAKLSLVDGMAALALQNISPSKPQFLHYVTRLTTSLTVQYVRLSAAAQATAHPSTPSAALLETLFNRYKSVLPWNSAAARRPPLIAGTRFPFGFKYPDRVKLEFIKFNAVALASTMHPTLVDVSDAYKYYQSHKTDFQIAPAKKVKGKIITPARYRTFDEVKTGLVRQQIQKKIQALFSRMAAAGNHLANKPWTVFNATGYYRRVAAAKWVTYQAIAAKLTSRFGYQPEIGEVTHWSSATRLSAYRDISSALTQPGVLPQSEGLAYLAMRVRGLDPHSRGDGLLLHLQLGRQGPTLVNRKTGDMYIYRVTAVDPAHDPASLSRVKPKVVAAARLYVAFAQLEKLGHSMAVAAEKESLATLAKKSGQRLEGSGLFHPLVSRPLYANDPHSPTEAVPSPIRGLPFTSRRFVSSAFQIAYEAHLNGAKPTGFSGLTKAELSAIEKGRLLGPDHPATSIALHRYLSVIVMQLGGYSAVPKNVLSNLYLLEGAQASMENDKTQHAYVPWFAFKQVAARVGFKAAR